MKGFILSACLLMCVTYHAQTNLWGMTCYGGETHAGTLFTTDGNGNNYTVDHDLQKYDGAYPSNSHLTLATDGKLYGLITNGGLYSDGIICQYDHTTNGYVKLFDFNDIYTGSSPCGSLIQATNGMMYGMTSDGGQNNLGTLFQFNPVTKVFTKKIDFAGAANGSHPKGSLMQATDGMLYGMTSQGGTNCGVIFQYNPVTGVLTKKIDLTNSTGCAPEGGLIEAWDGKLYGLTVHGGIGNGALFQYDPATNILTKKIDFIISNGKEPYGDLLQASNGKLYGLTTRGGGNDKGVLFEYNITSGSLSNRHDFTGGITPATGTEPYGSLIQASNGMLYGITSSGGVNGSGTIYQYNINTGIFTKNYDLLQSGGYQSRCSLLQAPDGNLYGYTGSGGLPGFGTLFQYNPVTNAYVKKIEFDGAIDGKYSNSALLLASDNRLYGVTSQGGTSNLGVLFQYNPISHIYSKKIDFNGTLNGSSPKTALIQASDGKLYGVTNTGGTSDLGVLYQYDISSNTFSKKVNFSVANNGTKPNGALVQASDGKLYGVTYQGGANSMGVLYQYDIVTNTYAKKIDFAGTTTGSYPEGALMQASDGKLYGTTASGGSNSSGTLFQYDPVTAILTKKADFGVSSLGGHPVGSLIQATDGKIYGITNGGGSYSFGTLFQYNVTTGACYTVFSFNRYVSGSDLHAALVQAGDGNLYGVAGIGGANEFGTLFQYSPVTNTLTVKQNFTGVNGLGAFSTLIETPLMIITNTVSTVTCAGSAIDVPFGTSELFGSGNVFTAQLSDASGSFASAVSIGSLTLTAATSGTINAFIPTLTNAGTGYRIRVVGSNPVVTGSDNGANITINAPLVFTVSSSPGAITCLNPSGSCTLTTTNSFVWSGPGVISPSTTSPVITVFTGGIYTVTVSNGSCYSTGTVAVTSNTASPSITVSPSNPSFCDGGSMAIFANSTSTNSLSYAWNNSMTTPSISVSPTVTTVYTATVTDNTNGCYVIDSTMVSVFPLPVLTVTGPGSVCIGSGTGIGVTGALTYAWSNGATTASISVNPTTTTTYTVTGTNQYGCISTETVSVMVDNTCADVWPGDANSDGTADNLDVLELGLHYTQTGALRASVGNNWQPYFANNWTGTISNGKNLNHSDCNGDGAIDDNDTLAIYNNYGLTHTFRANTQPFLNPQLSVVPDQPMVVKGAWGSASIYLGDATNPINNINGIAFTIDFDNTLIEPNSIYIEYQNSFIDAAQNLYFRKLDFSNGKIFTATTHTVTNNVNGYGKIATLHYQVLSSLTTDEVLNIGLSYANQSTASGIITPLTAGTGTLMAVGASVGLNEDINNSAVFVSPNPAYDVVNVSFSKLPRNTRVELYNSIGALVIAETVNDKVHVINTTGLSNGLYIIKVLESNKVTHIQKVVKH